jgi:hypothetical protein
MEAEEYSEEAPSKNLIGLNYRTMYFKAENLDYHSNARYLILKRRDE